MGRPPSATPSSATTRASAIAHVAHGSLVSPSVPRARGGRAPLTVRRRARRGADHEAHALELVEHHALGRHPDRPTRLAHPHLGAEHHHHAPARSSTTTSAPRLRGPWASPSTTRPPPPAAARGEPGRARGCPGRAPPPRPRPRRRGARGRAHHHALGELGPLHHLALVALEVVGQPRRGRPRAHAGANPAPPRPDHSEQGEAMPMGKSHDGLCHRGRLSSAPGIGAGPPHGRTPRPAVRSSASWGRGWPLGGVSRSAARACRARRGTPRPRA